MESSTQDGVQKSVHNKPRRHPALSKYLEKAIKLRQLPCRDEQLMIGPSSCRWTNFAQPLLRRYPHDPADFSWIRRIDGGMDGFVWEVEQCGASGQQPPFALKVFWENEPSSTPTNYWAFQRECQNAALLEMIATAIERATTTGSTESSPIYINPEPTSREDAIANLFAFSEDGGPKGWRLGVGATAAANSGSLLVVSSMPRQRKCFGWLKIRGDFLQNQKGMAPPTLLAEDNIQRQIQPDQEYFAIVYEYIPEADNDPVAVQSQLDFYWRTGFSFTPVANANNWKNSVLVDLSELVCPWSLGWTGCYGKTKAERQLKHKCKYDWIMPSGRILRTGRT